MALIARFARQSCRILTRPAIAFQRSIRPTVCFISTSKKNKDAMILEKTIPSTQVEDPLDKTENWISYGYDPVDREIDEFTHHAIFFVSITVCMVGMIYVMAYAPDYKELSWNQREAYLELARREREGLELVSKDLISPDKINLPADEEMGNYEIII